MEVLKRLPDEILAPLLPCFGLLKNCNILLFDDRPLFSRFLAYFYILPCVVAFYTGLTIYLIESLRRSMDLGELTYIVSVYMVCTQTHIMEVLKRLPDEILAPLLPCFGLLKNCNILLFDDRPLFSRFLAYFYILPCVVAFYTGLTIYLIESLRRSMDLGELTYIVSVYMVCTQTIFKASIVLSNMQKIRSLILRLGNLWRIRELSEVQISKKNMLLKRLKFCYAAFYWMNIIGSWQYMLAPLLETIVRRYILQQESGLLLPFGCYFPFDPSGSWGIYLLVYFFEIYSMFRIIYCYLGTEFLMIILCSHLGTEFTLLQEDLLHVKPSSKRGDISHFNETGGCASDFDGIYVDEKEELRGLIRRHQILIGFTQDLDDIFNKMIFVNLSSASISICFFGLSAKVSHDAVSLANSFVGVIASMLPIFNLCYYGELLKNASEGIAVAAYTNLWYNGDMGFKKAMWFIINRSQKPCSLTSLKYNPIALSTFTTVMSTTWSYFSLASSLYDES